MPAETGTGVPDASVDRREARFRYSCIVARGPKLLSDNEIIIALATIVVFGIGAQWIGRLLGIPSLLFGGG